MLGLCACTLSGCTAVTTQGMAPRDDEAARVQLLGALQRSADAWNAGDLKAHLSIYDDTVSVMTRSGPRLGVAAIEASFSTAYFKDGRPKQALRMEQVSVRFLSADSALMTGRFILAGGTEPEQSGWFTLVWIRTPAGWAAVHDHTG